MRRTLLSIAATLVVAAVTTSAGTAAHRSSTLCVSPKSGCFATLQEAVDAAADGDAIEIAPGTYAGGVAIDVSVDIRGAGAGATTISGGGPVLTLGKEFAATEPTISISGVTITGGVNTSVPDHAVTQGGGVRIPQRGGFPFTTGATVTISDSVITGNDVASTQLLPPGFCGPNECSFASGGGIYNEGNLTLVDTRVSDNQAGAPGSISVVAAGAGIANTRRGILTIRHTFVTGNTALATAPAGQSADGAGIESSGTLTVDDSVVSDNRAELTSVKPTDEFGPFAVGGGLHIVRGTATITRSIISGNRVTVTASSADFVVGIAGGIDDDGTLTLDRSTVANNDTNVSVPASSQATAIVEGATDVDGDTTIRDSRFVSNSGTVVAPSGTALAAGGAIGNFGAARIERTVVTANRLTATGANGSAQGGGIANLNLGGPVPTLSLDGSVIAGNAIAGGPGLTVQGGGLFAGFPVTLTNTVVQGNRPDQCFGC